MRRARFSFGRVAARAATASLLALGNGCGTEIPSPGDLTGSGGSGSTSGSGGAVAGVGGEVGSGGAPADGSGSSDAGGSAPAGGSVGSGGALASGGTSGSGGGSASGGASGSGGGGPTFSLTSPTFESAPGCSTQTPSVCDVIPDENVEYMDNANSSPELHWTDAPAGTESFALVLFDVTYGQAHWALWNISGEETMLAADVAQDTATPPTPAGSQQANANFATTSEHGYFGPHVPCNVFEFQLYALSTSSYSPTDPDSSVLISIELQDSHETVLGVARLTARANDYDATCQ